MTFTSYKDILSNLQNEERIQPKYLDQFKKNPYTQPLDSYGVAQYSIFLNLTSRFL